MINDGPFFKFPFCSAWGLAGVDMHSTRINGFGKPTRLSTWQQMVQLRAFVVLMLELAATWSSYHSISNDAATALWINCPLYFARPTMGVDSFMVVRGERPRTQLPCRPERKMQCDRERGDGDDIRLRYVCYMDVQVPILNCGQWEGQMFPLCWRIKSDP